MIDSRYARIFTCACTYTCATIFLHYGAIFNGYEHYPRLSCYLSHVHTHPCSHSHALLCSLAKSWPSLKKFYTPLLHFWTPPSPPTLGTRAPRRFISKRHDVPCKHLQRTRCLSSPSWNRSGWLSGRRPSVAPRTRRFWASQRTVSVCRQLWTMDH